MTYNQPYKILAFRRLTFGWRHRPGMLAFLCYRVQLSLAIIVLLYLTVVVLLSLTGGFVSSALVSIIAISCAVSTGLANVLSLPVVCRLGSASHLLHLNDGAPCVEPSWIRLVRCFR
jgi:hypothetical protein